MCRQKFLTQVWYAENRLSFALSRMAKDQVGLESQLIGRVTGRGENGEAARAWPFR